MIEVQSTQNFNELDIDIPTVEKVIKSTCKKFHLKKAEISVVIVGNDEMSKLNKQFLNKTSATDCLSFDLSDRGDGSATVFEIIVNAEKAITEAKNRKIQPFSELVLYIVHGLLHNLGFDDLEKEDAKTMHETEDDILQQHGFGIVYNKNVTEQ